MDVAALAATVLDGRTQAAVQDAQVSVLKKALNTEQQAATKLLDTLALPLATEGSLGRNVNTYA
ncbi:YjfB family protein [Austwickia chelonae]|uniref:YjfB family protein n=1 Tax=Austwickia chelonae TaxID=100225 RepID=UPI000E24E2FC|nr:YjfB family protein [Austwickia chelonae]